MNWYKIAQQEYAPIAIVSYSGQVGELGISFNGGKTYIYQNVSPFIYKKIKNLLKFRNYRAAQKILSNMSNTQPPTSIIEQEPEDEKKQMLQQLYDEGYLK